jgi:thiamine pyrophosphokinase
MRVCIIANSPSFDERTAMWRARGADLVIVTDGAIERIPTTIAPHIVCGDMDSHEPQGHTRRFPTTEWILRECQESNDLEKSILVAIERGATQIDVVCAFGGRLDQTLMTFSVMERFHKEVPITLYHEGWEARLCGSEGATTSRCVLDLKSDSIISLVVRSQVATVSISNVRWALSQEPLTPGSRGLSNRALGGVVTTTVHDGCVVVCWRTEDRVDPRA